MRKSFSFLIGIVTVSFIYSGCVVGPQYATPKQDLPKDFGIGSKTDSSALVKWFDLFQDTALQTIIKTTLANNKDLATAAARVDEARFQLDVVRVNTLPSFGYEAQTGGGRADNSALKVGGGFNSGVNKAFGVLNWELDLWGRLKRTTEAARAQLLAQQGVTNALKVSLIAEVANAYFLLCDLDNRLQIAIRTVEDRKESTKIINERFKKGYVAELDKLQAMQQEAFAAALVPNIKRQITQVENALNVLMARMPQSITRGQLLFAQTLTPAIPVGLPSQLLERRPDIVAAEQSLKAQFQRIGIAKAAMFPTLSLTGVLGFASPQLSSMLNGGFVANGFAGVTGPIFQFNQNKNRVLVEQKRTEQAQLQYEQTVIKAFADVNNALVQNSTYAEEFARRKEQVDAATKAYGLSKARYEYGYTSYLEVLIQENNLFDAELQVSVLYQQRLNAMVALYRSLGGGWE
jgi:multidrug efflux system outer membrane protein